MQRGVAGYGRRKNGCKFGVKSGSEEGVGCLLGGEEFTMTSEAEMQTVFLDTWKELNITFF
jgi:hypothetical protein